ncbi:hypothetical protein MC885_005543 [Smutsia gigantea]|nr:hypothetical protein MC885_005543 [Smutsia gigantea]
MTTHWCPSLTTVHPLLREPADDLSPEERNACAAFCVRLAAGIEPQDLEDFSAVGKVCDVHVLSDRNSCCSEGTVHVKFCEIQPASGRWADWAAAAGSACQCTGLTGE